MSIYDLPFAKAPCGQCPFRTDCLKGWLGEARAAEIAEADSFTCHKNKDLQCAGHMVVSKRNIFIILAEIFFKDKIVIKNSKILFKNEKDFINHHKNQNNV